MAYVYRHIRLDKNTPFYIGIGSDDEGRHKRAYRKYNRNNHWHHIVNKHGYCIEIIEDNINWNDACSLEKELITLYGRMDLNKGCLVNLTDGGDGVLGILTVAWNKGKPMTKEWKAKLKLAMVGKDSNAKGKKWSEEARERIRVSRKDKMPTTKGMKFTEERKSQNRLNKPNRKGVYQFDVNGNKLNEYDSLFVAHLVTTVPKSSIYLGCINGREYHGFKWGYKKSLPSKEA